MPALQSPILGDSPSDIVTFLKMTLEHDLPEGYMKDMPAIGPDRNNPLGQLIKKAEPYVAILMAKQLKDPFIRNEWLNLYFEMSAKETPRAKFLRFIDKQDGATTALQQQYSFLSYLQWPEETIAYQISASLDTVLTAGRGLIQAESSHSQPLFTDMQKFEFIQWLHAEVIQPFREVGTKNNFEQHVVNKVAEYDFLFP